MGELNEQAVENIIIYAENEIKNINRYLTLVYDDFVRGVYTSILKKYIHMKDSAEELLKIMREVRKDNL
jgi:hypothetical protein